MHVGSIWIVQVSYSFTWTECWKTICLKAFILRCAHVMPEFAVSIQTYLYHTYLTKETVFALLLAHVFCTAPEICPVSCVWPTLFRFPSQQLPLAWTPAGLESRNH